MSRFLYIKLASCVLIFSIFAGVAGQTDLVPQGAGGFTVQAAINRLHHARIFPDDHEFMRRLAWIESKDGGDPKTFLQGYHGGIWQVDRDDFFHTQTSPVAILTYHPKIASKLNISWPDVRWTDLRKPFYSLLAARLTIALTVTPAECSRPIPTTTPDQASYFIRCYSGKKVNSFNTRDPQGFLMAISQCQRAMACRTNTF